MQAEKEAEENRVSYDAIYDKYQKYQEGVKFIEKEAYLGSLTGKMIIEMIEKEIPYDMDDNKFAAEDVIGYYEDGGSEKNEDFLKWYWLNKR